MNDITISDRLSEEELSSLEKATGVSRWRIGKVCDNPMRLMVGVDRTIVKFTYVGFVGNDDIEPLLKRRTTWYQDRRRPDPEPKRTFLRRVRDFITGRRA